MGKRSMMVGALALVAGAVVPAGAQALDQGSGLLEDPNSYVSWSGSFEDTAAVTTPAGPVCDGELGCDEFSVELDLPAGVWSRPGGLQIGITWPDEANDLDLYVYGPDDPSKLAARSDGFFGATSESVRIDSAPNGSYRVVIAPRYVEGAMSYQGLAEVEYAPAVEPVRDLLPNLVALKPRNLNFATGAYLVAPGVPGTLASCYPEETVEQGARRCLRFDQIVANLGDGPFELRYRMEGIAETQNLVQRIFRSDGTVTERSADTYEFHPAHAHFHYKNFAQSRLYAANPDGSKGALLRTGRKNGFCMIDVENTRSAPGEKGEGPRSYFFPQCNGPTERDAGGTYMRNGITPGWADVYNWFLADQFIEVTGVPNGEYVLETVADPNATILESTADDNVASARIRITGDSAEFVD